MDKLVCNNNSQDKSEESFDSAMAEFAVKTSSNKGGLEIMAWGAAEDVSERPQETQGAVKAPHPGSSAKQSPVAVWVR